MDSARVNVSEWVKAQQALMYDRGRKRAGKRLKKVENRRCITITTQPKPKSTIVRWLIRNFEYKKTKMCPFSFVYDQYCILCVKNGLKKVSVQSFGKVIRSVFPDLKTRRLRTHGNVKRQLQYDGFYLRMDSPLLNILESVKGEQERLYFNGRKRGGKMKMKMKDGRCITRQPKPTRPKLQDSLRQRPNEEVRISKILAQYTEAKSYIGEDIDVEDLRACRFEKDGKRKFLVKWLGFAEFENSWEPEEGLPDDLIRDFDLENFHSKKRKKRSVLLGRNAVPPSRMFPHPFRPEKIIGMTGENYRKDKNGNTIYEDLHEIRFIVQFVGRNGVCVVPYDVLKTKVPAMVSEFLNKSVG